MEINHFISTRKDSLFENTDSFLVELIPAFIGVHVIPVLREYKTHVENTSKSEEISSEKFLKNHFYQQVFIDFKCYQKMINLMEEWVKI